MKKNNSKNKQQNKRQNKKKLKNGGIPPPPFFFSGIKQPNFLIVGPEELCSGRCSAMLPYKALELSALPACLIVSALFVVLFNTKFFKYLPRNQGVGSRITDCADLISAPSSCARNQMSSVGESHPPASDLISLSLSQAVQTVEQYKYVLALSLSVSPASHQNVSSFNTSLRSTRLFL